MDLVRTDTDNAQTRHKELKETVLEFAKRRAKTAVGATAQNSKKKNLECEREKLLNGSMEMNATQPAPESDPSREERVNITRPDPEPGPWQEEGIPNPELSERNAAVEHETTGDPRAHKSPAEIADLVVEIEKKIEELVDRQRERKRLETKVRGVTELNHITKYAVNIVKKPQPRDTLTFLRRTDCVPEKGSRRSSEMAEIARDYHCDLQYEGIDVDPALRNVAEEEVFGDMPPPRQEADMGERMTS